MRSGYQVTVLTRSAANATDLPSGVQVREVDYDSNESLQQALQGQDALVSTVAMSAIPNQKRLIDAAIAAGVKHFVPAEYSMATRDPKAQWLPIYTSVIEIQNYLTSKEDQIDWNAINCGAMIEFVFDYPFVIDFDNHVATLWDGGNNALSLSTCSIVGKAIAGVLKQRDRVQNHRVQVHGATITQRQALAIAEKCTPGIQWTTKEQDAEPAVKSAMAKLQSGAAGAELMAAIMTVASAATFGNGHFDAEYKNPDNDWLEIDLMAKGEVEEAIRRRIEEGAGFAFRSDLGTAERMGDVSDQFVSKRC